MEIKGAADTISWYDENAAQYAQAIEHIVNNPEIAEFVELLGNTGKVLDAGCAAGRDTAVFSQRGLDVVGIDISKGLIAEARSRYPDIDFREASFFDLPFENETFDGIWARASLLHLENRAQVLSALQEFRRVLKLNGVVHILVKAQMGKDKTAIVVDKLSGHKRFFQYFTRDEMTQLLTMTGFTVVNISQYNETDVQPQGRPEVEWIKVLAKKL